MADVDPLIGKVLGHCRIERKLGAGGMGAVYLAHHTGLNKPVALKLLPPHVGGNADFIARFQREARLAARLEHPNVVQVFDVGEEQGVHYITMQYVEGKSLEAILKERKKLAVPEALSIVKRVAVALAAAHKLGIVHRDVKPANILLSREGVVKVADFGLAKDRDANRSVSETGHIVGTPYYMSPEQAQGEKVDLRSDLYSLGATFYHMVTGQRAFQGHTPLSIVIKHVSEEPLSPREIDPSIPEGVAAVIARLMRKKPEERYASAEELVRDLDGLKAEPGRKVASPPALTRGAGPPPSGAEGPKAASSPARPFDSAQGRPFDAAQGRPFDAAQGRPFDAAQGRPFDAAQGKPGWPVSRTALIALPVAGILVVGIVIGLVVGKSDPPPAPPPAPPAAAKRPEPPKPEPAPVKPPPLPKPPVPPPPEARARILAKFRDAGERRLTEELMGRVELFMRAVQKRDGAAVRGMLDRLAFGDGSDPIVGEQFQKIQSGAVELADWAVEDVELRLRPLGRPAAVCEMTYHLKAGKTELKVEHQPTHWVHRSDGAWYVTKPPRPADK